MEEGGLCLGLCIWVQDPLEEIENVGVEGAGSGMPCNTGCSSSSHQGPKSLQHACSQARMLSQSLI